MIERALAASARSILRHPRATALLAALVSLAALFALRSFRIDPDVASLFPRGDPTLELLRATGASEEGTRTLYVTLAGEGLEQELGALLERLRESPYLAEVAGTKEAFGGERARRARAAPLALLPESALAALEERLAPAGRERAIAESKRLLAEDPALGREIVARDPLGLRWILDEAARALLPGRFDPASPYLLLDDGRSALVRVRGRREPFDVDYSRALVADLEQRLAGWSYELYGGYEIARRDASRIRHDLSSSLYWSIPLLVLFLTWSTRSFYLAHALLLPVGVGVLWALGFGGLLLGPLTPLAVSGAAILMGLGIDFAIHYAERYAQERATRGHAEAVVRTQAQTGRALLYGMTTSVAAFLTIGLGSFASLERFGVLLALGLFAAWLATLLLLPLLLGRGRPPHAAGESALWARLARAPGSRASTAAALALGLLALASWAYVWQRGLVFDADPNHLRPREERLDRLFGLLGEQLGFSPLGVLAFVPATVGLDELERVERAVLARGELAFVDGPQHVLASAARRARIALFQERTQGWVEGTLADLTRAGFRAEALRATLEEWDARFRALPEDDPGPTRLAWKGAQWWRLSFHPIQHAGTADERRALRAEIERDLPQGALVLDPNALADVISPLLAGDLARSARWSALAVLVLVLVGVGNLRASLVALVPVAAGLGITLAWSLLAGWPLHPGNFIAIPLLLGLGVDDGIHMVLRAREGSRELVRDCGPAVWRTSATTCLGFGSLVSSQSPALVSLGVLVLVGMLACFLTSILIVPVLWKGLACSPRSSPSSS